MNTETIQRVIKAKEYQMMAIRELFPKSKQAHLDVIEKELKEMFLESVVDLAAVYGKAKSEAVENGTEQDNVKEHKAKKVKID